MRALKRSFRKSSDLKGERAGKVKTLVEHTTSPCSWATKYPSTTGRSTASQWWAGPLYRTGSDKWVAGKRRPIPGSPWQRGLFLLQVQENEHEGGNSPPLCLFPRYYAFHFRLRTLKYHPHLCPCLAYLVLAMRSGSEEVRLHFQIGDMRDGWQDVWRDMLRWAYLNLLFFAWRFGGTSNTWKEICEIFG